MSRTGRSKETKLRIMYISTIFWGLRFTKPLAHKALRSIQSSIFHSQSNEYLKYLGTKFIGKLIVYLQWLCSHEAVEPYAQKKAVKFFYLRGAKCVNNIMLDLLDSFDLLTCNFSSHNKILLASILRRVQGGVGLQLFCVSRQLNN